MAKAKGLYAKAAHVPIQKGSSQGRHPNTSTMNKHKRRMRGGKKIKKYRGQGR